MKAIRQITDEDGKPVVAGTYHVPVLLKESVDGLAIRPDGTYVDVTFGGGGHSREILSRLGEGGRLFSFDQDADAERNITDTGSRFTFVRSNFRYLENWMRYYGVEHIDGLLADLGVSSHHLDDGSRGFSFRFDSPLDMRMDRGSPLTAETVVNEYPEERLVRILREYGEERFASLIVRNIARARAKTRITTCGELTRLIEEAIPAKFRHQGPCARQTFQAIRIEVNGELEGLDACVRGLARRLKPGGRIAVLTFHSLEDRIVKNVFRDLSTDCTCPKSFPVCVCGRKKELEPVTKKPVTAGPQELAENSRSKCAKLRVAEKR